MNAVISGKYGVAGVKAAMTLAGFNGGAPRKPLICLGDAEIEAMRSKLKELGFLNK
jgi:4-hydroxy-2-oxoglutarate aldolase